MGNYFQPFSLRISEALMEKVKYTTEADKRSVNKQIEYILEEYIRSYKSRNGKIPVG